MKVMHKRPEHESFAEEQQQHVRFSNFFARNRHRSLIDFMRVCLYSLLFLLFLSIKNLEQRMFGVCLCASGAPEREWRKACDWR